MLDKEVAIPMALDVVSSELEVEESDEKSDDVLLPISEITEDVESPLVGVGGVYSGGDDVVLVKPPSAVEVSSVDEEDSVADDTPELYKKLEDDDCSEETSELAV